MTLVTHMYAVGILFIVMSKKNRYMKKNNNVDLPTYFRKMQITKKECLRCDNKMHQLDVCTYFLENKLGIGCSNIFCFIVVYSICIRYFLKMRFKCEFLKFLATLYIGTYMNFHLTCIQHTYVPSLQMQVFEYSIFKCCSISILYACSTYVRMS